jgi:TRAP-type mannitol/chloroaromatic compound transport system substrate-binding protein
MFLEAKVQTAKVDTFFSGIEMVIIDRGADKRPKYTCRVVRGWPGLEQLRELKKANASVADLTDFALQIQMPQEDQVVPLTVVDIKANKGFMTLICEVAQSA